MAKEKTKPLVIEVNRSLYNEIERCEDSKYLWRRMTDLKNTFKKHNQDFILFLEKEDVFERFKKYITFGSNITLERFLTIFPEEYVRPYWDEIAVSKRKALEKRAKENPQSVANGTLEYQIMKYGEEKGKEEYERICKLKRINPLNIEWWLNQGYSEEEAKIKRSERQSTFSLEKCITKHGEEEGTRIWKERQVKWQNTLQSREDYDEIKKRRDNSSLQFFQKKYPDDPEKAQEEYKKRCFTGNWKKECPIEEDVPGTLYYIYFWNDDIEFWKIGITRRSIGNRFWEGQYSQRFDLNKKVIKTWQGLYINECYRKEQEILEEMFEWRIKIDHNNFSTSEAFSKDVLLNEEVSFNDS